MPDETRVWDRGNPLAFHEWESSSSHQALLEYAQIGPTRNLKRYHRERRDRIREGEEIPSVTLRTMQNWLVLYEWNDRIRAFEELEAQRQIEVFQQERDVAEAKRHQLALRQLDIVEELQSRLLDALQSYGEAFPLDPEVISKLLADALAISRQEHGKGDIIGRVEVDGEISLESKSINELSNLLRDSIQGRLRPPPKDGDIIDAEVTER